MLTCGLNCRNWSRALLWSLLTSKNAHLPSAHLRRRLLTWFGCRRGNPLIYDAKRCPRNKVSVNEYLEPVDSRFLYRESHPCDNSDSTVVITFKQDGEA